MRVRPIVLSAALLLAGCATAREAYYNAWEKAGYAKRDRLVDDVKAARTSQDQAKTQFTSTLDQFKQLTGYKGGDLEPVYEKLKSQYDACASRAQTVRDRIASVRNVGSALFGEWKGEIGEIKDDDALQKQSQALYDRTEADYKTLLQRMDAAAASMDPVLQKFKNRVVYLKSNLNAQVVGSLAEVDAKTNADIEALVQQMQSSIAEADQFIAKLNSKGG